jgi:hypothetical protein
MGYVSLTCKSFVNIAEEMLRTLCVNNARI